MTSEVSANRTRDSLRRGLTAAAIAALALGIWAGSSYFQTGLQQAPAAIQSGTVLPSPRPLQPFALTGSDGKPFTLDNLKQNWHFLAIGYTHCPDVCPTTMATFDAIAKQTGSSSDKPGFVFVSVDPERDTPEKLRQYAGYFNPEFLAATGPHPALKGLTGQLGILYAKADNQETAMGYLVDHSASILLIDPQGRLSAIFSPPHDPAAMAEDFITITR
jgi:protein SCO1/2